jgi:hypothetical protein
LAEQTWQVFPLQVLPAGQQVAPAPKAGQQTGPGQAGVEAVQVPAQLNVPEPVAPQAFAAEAQGWPVFAATQTFPLQMPLVQPALEVQAEQLG